MSQEEAMAVVSYLPVREDYEAFRLAAARLGVPQKRKLAFRLAGVAIAVLSAAVFVLGNVDLLETVAWGLLFAAGLCVASFYDILQPYLVKRQADAQFDTSRRLVSQTVELYQSHIAVRTDRYEAALPYELLYRVVEGRSLFLFYTGEDEARFIPKRVMTGEQCVSLVRTLTEKLGERYQKL